MGIRVWGLGFRVQGLGFRVVYVSSFGLGCRVVGAGVFRDSSSPELRNHLQSELRRCFGGRAPTCDVLQAPLLNPLA